MSKRRKAYKPRTGENIKLKMQPWKIKLVFDPLLAILDELEQEGTLTVEHYAGNAIFKDHGDGCWYDMHAAIMGVVEACELHESRSGRLLGLQPLRQLANKIKCDMPIFESDTGAVRQCLDRMRAETLEMTAGYARDLIKVVQIREEVEKHAA